MGIDHRPWSVGLFELLHYDCNAELQGRHPARRLALPALRIAAGAQRDRPGLVRLVNSLGAPDDRDADHPAQHGLVTDGNVPVVNVAQIEQETVPNRHAEGLALVVQGDGQIPGGGGGGRWSRRNELRPACG